MRDGQHGDSQNDVSARKAHCQGIPPIAACTVALRHIGDHTEQPLLHIKPGF